MSIRDWPRPIRRLLLYLIIAAVLTISCGPLLVALINRDIWKTLNPAGHAFVAYTLVTTGAVTMIVSAVACWKMPRDLKYRFSAYLFAGPLIGFVVGLCLIPLTVGASFIIAPPFGLLAALLVFGLRSLRPGR